MEKKELPRWKAFICRHFKVLWFLFGDDLYNTYDFDKKKKK